MAESKINAGVDAYKNKSIDFGTIAANKIVTLDADISNNPAIHRILKGWVVGNTGDVAVLIITFVDINTIRIRVRNLTNSSLSGGNITVYYA